MALLFVKVKPFSYKHEEKIKLIEAILQKICLVLMP